MAKSSHLKPLIVKAPVDVARILGVKVRNVEQWRSREDLAGVLRDDSGKITGYNATECVHWWALHKWGPANLDKLLPEEEQPKKELSISDRAKLLDMEVKQLKLAERREELFPRDLVENVLQMVSQRLATCGEVLLRRCGAEAQTILNDTLDACAMETKKLLQ